MTRHRALLTAALVAAAVATALPAVAPDPVHGTPVVVAARDLAAGTVLSAADVTHVLLPPDVVPHGVPPDGQVVLGRVLAAAMRRGEPLTDVRLLGPGLLVAAAGGLVAVPVRLADPASASLVQPGDRVDVLAAVADPGSPTTGTTSPTGAATGPAGTSGGAGAATVAGDVQVLAVPGVSGDADGALVVVAVPASAARRLAAAEAVDRLSLVLLPATAR